MHNIKLKENTCTLQTLSLRYCSHILICKLEMQFMQYCYSMKFFLDTERAYTIQGSEKWYMENNCICMDSIDFAIGTTKIGLVRKHRIFLFGLNINPKMKYR